MIYTDCHTYPAPHGRDLQEWFRTSSRLLLIEGINDLFVVLDDGGALLFTNTVGAQRER